MLRRSGTNAGTGGNSGLQAGVLKECGPKAGQREDDSCRGLFPRHPRLVTWGSQLYSLMEKGSDHSAALSMSLMHQSIEVRQQSTSTRLYAGGELRGSPVGQALSGHKRRIPLAVVLPRPGRGAGTLLPSAQRLVWAAKQPLGNAALGALFA